MVICKFLKDTLKDEEKATLEYAKAIEEYPEESDKLEKILKDEKRHTHTFNKLIKKYNCR